MAQLEYAQPFNAFAQGRAMRQDEDYANSRNALARADAENAPAEAQRRNKLADLQTEGAQMGIDAERAKQGYARLKQALDSGNPKAYVLQREPELAAMLQKQGVDLASIDDETAARVIDGFAREYAGKAGMLPEQPAQMTPYQQAQIDLEERKLNTPKQMSPYEQARIGIEERKLNQPKAADTGPLVQVAGPDGNPVYATRDEAVGKPAYVARDKPAAADEKYKREIKSKQPRLQAAIRRVDRLAEAAESIAQNKVFDGGPLDQHAINWTKQGQEMEQAAASLVPELTALTRVPGIGSQSDLETRLAGLQFPSSKFAPEVNRKAVAELKAFMADLKDVYGSVESEFQNAEVQSLLDKYAPQ
jgi:hypothetical protein